MRITLTHKLPNNTALAGSTIPIAARFYNDDTWALAAPTTARWRVYDTETHCELVPWTTITPATTATISIPGTATESECRRRVELVLEADTDLATQHQERKRFVIDPLAGQ